MAKLLVEVDQAGMDWSPVRGPASEAVPIAVAHFTAIVKILSDEQRTITSGRRARQGCHAQKSRIRQRAVKMLQALLAYASGTHTRGSACIATAGLMDY